MEYQCHLKLCEWKNYIFLKNQSVINTNEKLKQLENDYDAIFLGVGLGKTATLQLEGEDKKGVIGAVEFIEELRMKKHLVK